LGEIEQLRGIAAADHFAVVPISAASNQAAPSSITSKG
jgi:hypothetical protein